MTKQFYQLTESKAGATVRVLASHQWGPGSNPGINAIQGSSLLLVLCFALRGFLREPHFFPLLKNNNFQISIWDPFIFFVFLPCNNINKK